ncbi:MarR family winged helix-turn-helix transcriptional regulator [Peribacillus sp. SCS-155]|uniref:MarR family winged helix-turn-helix transcriptional regulator n=1 Tax=Peribacillus sedimenti TaxID=3115297 RepID=UPI0039064144
MSRENLYQAVNLFGDVLFEGVEMINKEINLDILKHISREQIDLLNILKKKGACSPGSLAVSQGVHKSAISNRLTKLLNKGLIECDETSSIADKRSKLVRLTVQGEKTLQEIETAIFQKVETLLADIEDEKIDTFIDIFTTVKEKLKEKGDTKE